MPLRLIRLPSQTINSLYVYLPFLTIIAGTFFTGTTEQSTPKESHRPIQVYSTKCTPPPHHWRIQMYQLVRFSIISACLIVFLIKKQNIERFKFIGIRVWSSFSVYTVACNDFDLPLRHIWKEQFLVNKKTTRRLKILIIIIIWAIFKGYEFIVT